MIHYGDDYLFKDLRLQDAPDSKNLLADYCTGTHSNHELTLIRECVTCPDCLEKLTRDQNDLEELYKRTRDRLN